MNFLLIIWHGMVHWTGSDYGTTYGHFVPYNFLSGIFGGSAFVTGAWVIFHRHNCARKWCWRIGSHEFRDPADGVTRNLCWKHHPDVQHKNLTDELIRHIHRKRIKGA